MPIAKKTAATPPLRVISLNLNGIRSAARKGVFAWLTKQAAEIVCVQELKAQDADLTPEFRATSKLKGQFHFAQKKGYSGAGLYAARAVSAHKIGFGSTEFDAEGRYVRADFNAGRKALTVISVYVPSGSSSEERQLAKFRFMAEFLPHLAALQQEHRDTGREFILCGDWNIAHQQRDLTNWRSNQKNSGFLPEERAWLTRVFDELGWVDVYRRLYPDATGTAYTWWSNRGQAWANNVGWRIDYQIATPGIAGCAIAASVYKRRRFSDHAPLVIDYAWP